MHVILAIFFSLLLDGGLLSEPGVCYCITIIAYFTVRSVIATKRSGGYPILTRLQWIAVALLPLYALPWFMMVLGFGHWLRFGT
jgi:hypothetical protein